MRHHHATVKHACDQVGRVTALIPDGLKKQLRFSHRWGMARMNRWALCCLRLHVRNNNRQGIPKLVTLIAQCGPRDIDDPSPAITIMLPGED